MAGCWYIGILGWCRLCVGCGWWCVGWCVSVVGVCLVVVVCVCWTLVAGVLAADAGGLVVVCWCVGVLEVGDLCWVVG